MPPKKRKASAAAANTTVQPPKKVRIGDTSTIDSDSQSTPSGRSQRSTVNDNPQYNFTNRRNTTAGTTTTDVQPNLKATPATKKETGEVKKRGRPPNVPTDVKEEATIEVKKRGRPAKKTTPPVQEPGARRGILKIGNGRANISPISTPTRVNVRAPGGSTASAAKRRSSFSAQPASRTPKKTVKASSGTGRGRPPTKKPKAAESPRIVVSLASAVDDGHDEDVDEDTQYWLMKAEPDSRIEKGVDVKFSIDDLASRTEPEGWDGQCSSSLIWSFDRLTFAGVRNAVARNNMRAMRVGDLAFFYHSNCKVPGVAGIMRVVAEHSVDESAFDPDHPYYDAKSNRDNPKWELVKVEFVKKFDELVTLKELRSFAAEGGTLADMQTLKQSRLSVTSVQPSEWRFILDLAGEPHSLGQPTKADDYESDTDGETEGHVNGMTIDAEATDSFVNGLEGEGLVVDEETTDSIAPNGQHGSDGIDGAEVAT